MPAITLKQHFFPLGLSPVCCLQGTQAGVSSLDYYAE